MANILLYAVIPCVIIRSYITDFTMEKLYGLLMSAVLAVAAFAVAIAVSYIIYGMRKPIDNFGTAFCNAGFIGIPLELRYLEMKRHSMLHHLQVFLICCSGHMEL